MQLLLLLILHMGNLPVTIELAHDRASSLWSQYPPKIGDFPSLQTLGPPIPHESQSSGLWGKSRVYFRTAHGY